MNKFPHKVCAASLLALLLAACGGGGGSSSGGGSADAAYPVSGANAPAQVGLNPTDPALAAQQALLPPSNAVASSGNGSTPTSSCKLTASYYAVPQVPNGPYIPSATATPGTATTPATNLDVTLAASGSWNSGSASDTPIVAGMNVNLSTTGSNVPAGYPTAPDTNRIQAALYACAKQANAYNTNSVIPSNGVVELASGAGAAQTAYVTGPLVMPGGVTLLIDKGVTLFASRDPVLYESGSTGATTPTGYMWGTPTTVTTTPTTPPTAPVNNVPSGTQYAAVTGTSVTTQFFCGQIYGNDNGCNALIGNVVYTGAATGSSKVYTSNNAVMGPGVIDGQGGQPMFSMLSGNKTAVNGLLFPALITRADGKTNLSWWDLGWEGNEALTGQDQNVPRLVTPQYGYNFTMFNVTLQNAMKMNVTPEAVVGFTAWGLKIFTPTQAYTTMQNYWGAYYDYATVKNADGFDPELKGSSTAKKVTAPAFTGSTAYGYANNPDGSTLTFTGDMSNILLAYSYISTSDDDIAIKGENSSSGPGKLSGYGGLYNMTVVHNHFFYGHGMSIGSQTAGGGAVGTPTAGLAAVATPLTYVTGTPAWSSANQTYATQTLYPGVTNVNVYDLSLDYTDNGVRIKTNWSEGGLVSNINYTNLCMQGNPTPSTYDASAQTAIYIFPAYSPTANQGLLPSYQNITMNGVHELTAARWQMQGFNSSTLTAANGWNGGPGTTTTTIDGVAPTGPIINPLGLTLNNVVADVAPMSPVIATDANLMLGSNVSSNLGLPALNGTNNVTVTTNSAMSAAQPVDCSQAFSNISGNTDVMTGAAINSPFPGEQFPINISGQTTPAK